ncbi:Rv0361 family membrane protein [Rhodococcus sp. B50]|uniref:Rv0361 family membrane protein n=1 Tax=Rhodococcus sp. B50 TaxID=2682847 RepID=UPI001BD49BDD|nr:hypothetical protein [Rhodococcus sp. B50]MBS9375520.1 hypothetical protein [Rhodococcus sp. B50]
MSDPKNEETPEKTSTTPDVGTPDGDTENEPADDTGKPDSDATPPDADMDETADTDERDTNESIATDETVALPVVEQEAVESRPAPEPAPDVADAPTVQIPVRNHVPKAPPQRIAPRGEEPPARPEPVRVAVQPTPTRIPPARDKGRGRWLGAAGAAAALVVVAIVVAAVVVFLQERADNSPESRIRSSIDTFVGALESGDLATLQKSTCGALSDFYATVEPQNFRDIHRLAVEQGEIPVVTSVDRIQITDGTAIAQVTAHTANNPSDVTDRTFDLALDGEQWKVCSE